MQSKYSRRLKEGGAAHSTGLLRSSKAPVGKSDSARQRALAILDRLRGLYPNATTELHYRTPFELLVATILSAQCTDERVNRVTPALFARYKDPKSLAEAHVNEVEVLIKPTGFYKNKARHIVGMSRVLVERFNGEVPRSMEELVTLPGVARKTANVVLGTAYGIAEGVVVDTHVARLAGRLGLSDAENPERIEQALMELLPRSRWIEAGHLLILHGRRVCTARAPQCETCAVRDLCPTGMEKGSLPRPTKTRG